MEEARNNRIVILILVLALLLHGIALIFLLLWQHHSAAQERQFQEFLQAMQEQQKAAAAQTPEQKKQQEEWAEMKARASEFGATVIFQDEPEMAAKQPAAQNKSEKVISSDKPAEKQEEKNQSKQEKEAVVEKATLNIDADDQLTDKSNEKDNNVKEEIEKHSAPEQVESPSNLVGSGTKDAAPEPPITLATITKGFLSTLDDGGTDSLSMRGKKAGTAPAEQLTYLRYREKISRCMANSHHIHRSKHMPRGEYSVVPRIFIRLLRNGTLAECRLLSSSGLREADNYALFIIRDAAPGFPPVPSAIKDELLQFVYTPLVERMQEKTSFRFSVH